jgi:hypothetical protein
LLLKVHVLVYIIRFIQGYGLHTNPVYTGFGLHNTVYTGLIMFILRYKKVVLCILDSAKVECIFEDLKDKSRVTTIIHHNYEEMVIPSTDGFEIKPDYFSSFLCLLLFILYVKVQHLYGHFTYDSGYTGFGLHTRIRFILVLVYIRIRLIHWLTYMIILIMQ